MLKKYRQVVTSKVTLVCCLAFGYLNAVSVWAHEGRHPEDSDAKSGLVIEWLPRPSYTLPRKARHRTLETQQIVEAGSSDFNSETLPLRLVGNSPTQRFRNLLDPAEIPRGEFTFEAWLNVHVNEPVGLAAMAGNSNSPTKYGWAVAYHTFQARTSRVVASLAPLSGEPIELVYDHDPSQGFQEYWWHVVLSFDGKYAKLYLNGVEKSAADIPSPHLAWPESPQLELSAYLEREPKMQLANLLNHARLYRRALTEKEIRVHHAKFQQQLEAGSLHPEVFHFTAGPYLNYATENGIRILWETDRPARAKLEWGQTAQLGSTQEFADWQRIQEFAITGLTPGTPYFYRITAINEHDEQLDSGVLTFQTAVPPGEPVRFAVLGDTETRPHINHHVSKQVWGERPNFVVVLGDLTDGGMKDAKWQWNYEYFSGMAGLCSRVPFFPAPGNGEGDLYWYKKYHSLPEQESPYSFCYGDAEFFMLDSNLRSTEFVPGGKQYKWLEQRLQQATGKWKLVCFHHAPFTSDEDDYGDAWLRNSDGGDLETRHLVPLFEKYGVDVVMFGHIHGYERSRRLKSLRTSNNGVLYLLCGGGGGNLEDFAPNPMHFSAKLRRGRHYCMFHLHESELEIRVHDLTGALFDFCKLEK
jgi:predicted phosphodiesterase